ncbi:hypothetical protein PNA2_0915 [Pyrococcus sp. NA2]|uniref:6-pyruvoyl-tetrahydropterin synthase-related protein n=1 Tax=Pyrococcus sp. (strain NA2) TaxID=342949 RepID=UPI000209B05D|nr:6-pyruvoyl-tetrahydropterin synthase-related protein [Pyrococcus sp. NA2]AEC51831.1 hypothetical protein PNA2_0915 [Pyrococcus sp. NA2]
MKKSHVIILLTVSIIEFLPLFLAPEPPALSTDGNGHLFKINKLMESGWEPWIEEWYVGFPFLRFYPPLSYLIGAFFGMIFGSDIKGYATTLMLTSFIGSLSLYMLLRMQGKEPLIPSIIFLLYPWRLRVAYIEANYPRANAINLAPLFLLSIFLLSDRRERYLLISALGISILALTHHSILIPLIITGIILSLGEQNFADKLVNAIKVGSVVVILVSFWYVPFFLERKYAHFWNIYEKEWAFKAYSVEPTNPIWISTLITVIILILLGRKKKEGTLSLTYLYLSLGYYSPTPEIHKIFSLIPPYRWLDMLSVLLPLMIPKERKKKIVATTLIVGISVWLIVKGAVLFEIPRYPDDLLEIAEFLEKQPDESWRFLITPATAHHSYLPALCKRPTINGWYHEGDPADDAESRMWSSLLLGKNVTPYLNAYAIRFFLTPSNYHPPGYDEVTKIGKFRVYEKNVSFAYEVKTIMLGKFYDLPFDYAYLSKTEDLPLFPNLTVIYVGEPGKKEEERLLKFVKEGGTLIWVPEKGGNLFEIKANMTIIPNIPGFAEFKYEGGPWYGPVFSNVTPILTFDDKILIGEKKVGKGKVYLIGGNLIFHALYTNSMNEIELIKRIANVSMKPLPLLTRDRGYIKVKVEEPSVIRIAEAYYPYWRAKLNGKDVDIIRDDRTGVMIVPVNESGVLELEFKDPFERLRLYSLVAWLILLSYILMEFGLRRF